MTGLLLRVLSRSSLSINVFLVFHKKFCLKEDEVWQNFFLTKILSRLSHKVGCFFSSPVLLRKFIIIISTIIIIIVIIIAIVKTVVIIIAITVVILVVFVAIVIIIIVNVDAIVFATTDVTIY